MSANRATAIASAGAAVAAGYEQLDSLPVAEAARAAWTPTGPSVPELEERIRARRRALAGDVDVASHEDRARAV